MPTKKSPPASLIKPTAFYMPAEWHPHEATWLSWPHNLDTWPENILKKVYKIYLQMIKLLHENEKVNILINNSKTEKYVREFLHKEEINENVFIYQIPTDDAWIRDNGPNFVIKNKKLAINDWIFNAWGGKYPPWENDNAVPEKIAKILNIQIFKPGIILEGGSIEVNGEGLCLTTKQCLLNPNRNPQLNQDDIEKYLQTLLGIEQTIWLEEGIAGDDTDGHIDNLARFVNKNAIICGIEEDKSAENFDLLQENFKLLSKAKSQDGKKFEVISLPMPSKIVSGNQVLPACYLNFYIANKIVLAPIFNQKNDEKVLEVIQGLFPDRKVIGIYAAPFIWGFGAIHCLTLQQPLV